MPPPGSLGSFPHASSTSTTVPMWRRPPPPPLRARRASDPARRPTCAATRPRARDSPKSPLAPRGACRGDRQREQVSGERIAARGKCEVELPVRAAVQLGRSPGPRTATPRQPAVARVEQVLRNELVEVERRQVARHPERARRLVAAHVPPPTPDIAIKTPPHGVVQQGDRRDQTLKLGFPHGAQYNAHPPGRPTPERRRAVADTPRVAFLPHDGAERPVLVKADTGCCKTYVHRL